MLYILKHFLSICSFIFLFFFSDAMNFRFDVPFFGVLVLIKYGFRSVSSDQREITMILKTCEIKGFMRDIK